MSKQPSPRLDQLRAMREAKFTARGGKKPKAPKVKRKAKKQ